MEELERLVDRLMAYGAPTTSIVLSTALAPRNVVAAPAISIFRSA